MSRAHAKRARLAVLVSLCMVAGAVGCSEQTAASGNSSSAVDKPHFTGAWSASFEQAWQDSQTKIQRNILRDGKITERENNELQDLFDRCMQSAGVKVTWDGGGAFTVRPADSSSDPRSANGPVDECEKQSTGVVSPLYYQVRSNPTNRDMYSIMAACLVREHLTDAGYSASDYRRDFESNSFAFTETDPRFISCNSDPLGILSETARGQSN